MAVYVVMECYSYRQYVTMRECAKGKPKLCLCSHKGARLQSTGSGIAECSPPVNHVTKADVPMLKNNNGGYRLIKETMPAFFPKLPGLLCYSRTKVSSPVEFIALPS